MFFLQREHNPPHIHAEYGDDEAEIDIKTGECMEGYLPPTANKLVSEWIELHRTELLDMWETQTISHISPLE